MMTIASKAKSLVEELKVQRDELSVKLTLDNAETVSEWEYMEAKWQEMEAKYTRLGYSVGKSILALDKDLERIGGELRSSFALLNQSQLNQSQLQAA